MKKIGLILLMLPLTALAALDNADRVVGNIDLMATKTVIWIGGDMNGQSADCNNYKAVSCDNTTDFCKAVLSTALAAQALDKKVEFNFGNDCNGSFANINRFRMMQ